MEEPLTVPVMRLPGIPSLPFPMVTGLLRPMRGKLETSWGAILRRERVTTSHGGYQRRWVRLQAGRLSLYFLNTKARVRAVRLHDLHHVRTGYETTWSFPTPIGLCADGQSEGPGPSLGP